MPRTYKRQPTTTQERKFFTPIRDAMAVPDLVEGDEVFYAVLPLFHAYGMTLCLTFAMSIGARLVLFPKFDAALVLDAARHSPPTGSRETPCAGSTG